ncbi:hypothetical protein Fmac_029279 [Flemingia macrophylla]|uniref:Uncharacterized protein n=1 Tax=Flemingia macrophylla TaxID=520843 RepID=A0ABD1L9W1_9FABA
MNPRVKNDPSYNTQLKCSCNLCVFTNNLDRKFTECSLLSWTVKTFEIESL